MSRMRDQKSKLESEMKNIFFDSTIEEWIETNINPLLSEVEKLVSDAEQQLVYHEMANIHI